MPTLTFNSETHTYLAEGTKVPSVSEVLRVAGLIDMDWVSEEAMKRGSFVHQTIEFYLQRDLDEAGLDPKLAAYLAAWKAAEREMCIRVLRNEKDAAMVEQRVFHPIYKYAGTLDVLAMLVDRKVVIDIKTGAPSPWHRIQLAGYAMTFTDEMVGRVNLYLSVESKFDGQKEIYTGKYKFVEHRDRNDFNVWKAALTIAQERKSAGLLK
jgi:hypothetical protein